MGLRLLSGVFAGVSVLLVASLSHAQCSKDTDCKGDRICEAGTCVAPNAALPPAPPPPAAAVTTPPAQPAAAPAPVQDNAVAARPAAEAPREAPPPKPKMRRHSTGMMVGGIVMTSLSPFALIVSLVGNLDQSRCERESLLGDRRDLEYRDCSSYDARIYGGLLVGGALLAAGIPMIMIGAKKEPVPTATLRGWVTAGGGGLGLRVDL